MKSQNLRTYLIFSFFMLAALAITGRLFFIQIKEHAFYKALAAGQHKQIIESEGERGDIFFRDKNGSLYAAATDKNKLTCYLKLQDIKNPEETADFLSQAIAVDKSAVLALMSDKENFGLEELKDNLTDEEAKRIQEKKLAGVYVLQARTRFYPQRKLAAQDLGFLGGEGTGQYGLEGFYDDSLKGKSGFQMGERNPWGFNVSGKNDGLNQGSDLVLTIDYNIQQTAETLLSQAEKDLKIESGQILVLEPATGKIIALANFPIFDLNDYGGVENQEIFKNAVIQKLFEPGSVFKPFVMVSALQEEKVTPETTYEDLGSVQVGSYIIYNYGQRVWGKQTMTEVLQKSINTGAVFVEKQLGDEKFLEYIEKFGFFEPTAVDLQGEAYSENRILRNGRPINFMTTSFGQGIEITPLQLARAFSALVNGGKLMRPYIVEKIIHPDGTEVIVQPKIQRQDFISKHTLEQLKEMLVSVVEKGFGKAARISGYSIGGKTGTAQVALSVLGINEPGYSDKTVQSFAGFFPASNPKFLILVKLDNPEAKTAEYSAVPIFHELAKYIIDYLEIPPDQEE